MLILIFLGLMLAAPDTRVAEAAKRGDAAAVRSLLAAKADVNGAPADGTTALHWASRNDDVALAKALLAAGAKAGAVNRYGVAPLSLACENGDAALVDLLLTAGADANTKLPGGETALMTAARAGRVEAVRKLIAKGAVVDAKEEKRGQTALFQAAAEGHAAVIEELIRAGADFKMRIVSGWTPLLIATREGRTEAVRALLKAGAPVDDTIQPAPTSGRVAGGAPPRSGSSALMIATVNGHFELGAVLLAAGANPNHEGAGWTALHAVSNTRKPGVGDNNPPPDGSGKMTSLAFVKLLKEYGADVNRKMVKKINAGLTSLNTLGATPFFMAARTCDVPLMKLLADLGADTKATNADRSTPLMAAAGLGTRSPGEDAGTEPECLEAVETLLAMGADLDAVDEKGETAMHGAAYKNYPAVVRLLARRGAKREVWDKPNKQGWTPLRIAEGYRFGNYKPSPDTMAAFHEIMGIQKGSE